jgi:putative two-component system response regulator
LNDQATCLSKEVAAAISVADIFDTLTTKRQYKEAMSLAAARQFLKDGKGRDFDPACVGALSRVAMKL